MSHTNNNYLIVGGRTGIGQSVVNRLIDAGANLWCASRQPSDEYQGRGINFIELDVTSDDHSVLEKSLPETLHGLVYCPGTINLKPFQSLKPGDFRNDIEINLLGAIKVMQASQANLKEAGGASVVLFSTVATRAGMNYHASITAAKAAVEGLAIALAAEWARLKIRINVIAPSLTDTPLAARLLSDEQRRTVAAEMHPLKRVGTPEDIASAVDFLLGDQSSWISGQVLGIDGGLSTLRPL